jgi:asparagine synthase (glutamine-hydrolysing)
MCGIAVHFSAAGHAAPLDLALIRHRGPDSSGDWTSPDGHCWLGNTRLAILDLSPAGDQPMVDRQTGNVLVVNGEIYNHLQLREQLGGDLAWRGTSDTETLLNGYARWHHGLLDRLKGMFAFAIYDAAREELFVARDRLGIKPLYYAIDGDGIRFASELKMLRDTSHAMTRESVASYLKWGASPEEQLLYSGIESFPAGHAMVVDRDGNRKIWRYWPTQNLFSSPPENAAVKVRGLVERAVDEHLLSDVPVAVFLSGGIDSSIIAAIAAQKLHRKLQTYSVAFAAAEFDESAVANEVAARYGTDHHRIDLSADEVLASVTEAVEHLDLPSVDAINTYIVSKAVASRHVKVALSGLGGDELFGGYASFRDVPRLRTLSLLPPPLRNGLRLFGGMGKRLAELPARSTTMHLALWRRRFFTDAMLRDAGLPVPPLAPQQSVSLRDEYAQISWAELSGYMRRMLLRDADQMSMAVSLELRVPFLDHELVEYVLGLPAETKKQYRWPKGLLVEACRDLLPASVYERPKRGFVLPMRDWMLGPLADFVRVGVDEVSTRELLRRQFISECERGFRTGRLHWTRLWSVAVLGHFAKRSIPARSSHEDPALHSYA